MELIPALDLRGGQVVRLRQGDFSALTRYAEDPIPLARRFAEAGFRRLHVVDLDGAEAGEPRQSACVARIAQAFGGEVELGGGLRREADLEAAFASGITRAVVGSAALADPQAFSRWLSRFGADRIVLALDVREEGGIYRVRSAGWKADGGLELFAALSLFCALGVKRVLCTDIARDGMLTGPNLALYRAIREAQPALALIASGGIRHQEDLASLAVLGIEAAVIGRALLEGRIASTTPC
ncbi:MAG: 1-(5-phosphoribosyl)-5-[(5-phosphoribosylamino) methylideneamino] imidazole-4-carboxamide isomerase [Lysobacterales bacterium]|jgi:phosphoribosylformimino-5-aminoimidazole carboxamide ribotide isomerase|nr:MAG: 1-(5-phosphoribosyl)-5-[(5-phosphoribosylamino) methylideneamino] imidazole-4-carboxamide isomerase [Xanthomonadales bacterium]